MLRCAPQLSRTFLHASWTTHVQTYENLACGARSEALFAGAGDELEGFLRALNPQEYELELVQAAIELLRDGAPGIAPHVATNPGGCYGSPQWGAE